VITNIFLVARQLLYSEDLTLLGRQFDAAKDKLLVVVLPDVTKKIASRSTT